MSSRLNSLREFGNLRVDLRKKVLWHRDELVPLPAKAVEVLCALVERNGDVVTKDELLDKVWRESFVEESVLSQNIHHLRKALRKLNVSGEPIQTIPRRGYRFTADVRSVDEAVVVEHEIVERNLLVEIAEDSINELPGRWPATLPATLTQNGRSRFALASVFALAILLFVGSLAWYLARPTHGITVGGIRSIAVLPLKAFDNHAENEALRMRITDALITRLGRHNDLIVRPTNSVIRFASTDQDIIEAGRTLGVDAVLDGRLQEENGRLRVTLQLISVDSGNQLWAHDFDGRSGEILPLQDAISDKLLAALQLPQIQPPRKFTQNNEAYEAYLKGRYFWNQRTPESYLKAINHFEEAIRLDPTFTLAYSGLADTLVLFNPDLGTSPDKALSTAKSAAAKALELDDTSAEAHASNGLVLSVFERDMKRSNEHYRRAITLDPNYSLPYAWYGMNLISLKRFDEAEEQLRNARRLDPTSRNISVYQIVNYYVSRRYDAAIEQARAAIELEPSLTAAWMFMSRSYEQKEMYREAVDADLQRQRLVQPEFIDELRTAFEASGIRGFWQKQVELRQRNDGRTSTNCTLDLTARYVLLGETQKALETIERDFRYGGTCWNFIYAEPQLDGLRSEPRFQRVIREMGFNP